MFTQNMSSSVLLLLTLSLTMLALSHANTTRAKFLESACRTTSNIMSKIGDECAAALAHELDTDEDSEPADGWGDLAEADFVARLAEGRERAAIRQHPAAKEARITLNALKEMAHTLLPSVQRIDAFFYPAKEATQAHPIYILQVELIDPLRGWTEEMSSQLVALGKPYEVIVARHDVEIMELISLSGGCIMERRDPEKSFWSRKVFVGSQGTLGGFLVSRRHQQAYGLTCAHVPCTTLQQDDSPVDPDTCPGNKVFKARDFFSSGRVSHAIYETGEDPSRKDTRMDAALIPLPDCGLYRTARGKNRVNGARQVDFDVPVWKASANQGLTSFPRNGNSRVQTLDIDNSVMKAEDFDPEIHNIQLIFPTLNFAAVPGDSGSLLLQTIADGQDPAIPAKVYAVGLLYATNWQQKLKIILTPGSTPAAKKAAENSIALAIPIQRILNRFRQLSPELRDLELCEGPI